MRGVSWSSRARKAIRFKPMNASIITDPVTRSQRHAVLALMADGRWRCLHDIVDGLAAQDILASESGISARMRDLRKPQFGAWTVERRLTAGANRLYEYRVLPPNPSLAAQQKMRFDSLSRR